MSTDFSKLKAPTPADSPSSEPPSYLVLSIICTVLCFPTALISIKESISCEHLKSEGKMELASIASQKAKRWLWYSFILGILALLVTGLLIYQFWPLLMEGFQHIRIMILDRLIDDSYYI